jgi:hypothetical protein
VSYQRETGLRCFMFSLGAVFAATSEEADQFADRHGMWNRRPDGSWGREASAAHAQLCLDQQAAYRALAERKRKPLVHTTEAALERWAPGSQSAADAVAEVMGPVAAREDRQARAGQWMTRSVPQDER